MKKVFISQPMRGLTDEHILEIREAAKRKAEKRIGEEVEVIDSFFRGTNLPPLECLGESIKLLAKADVVYFVYGWEQARGCRIEFECACAYDLKVLAE